MCYGICLCHVAGLSLLNGRQYSVEVTALNKARLATKHESHGVIVDTTPPVIDNVSTRRLCNR
jgi:CheY-specific phosphatase CheX